MEWTDYDQKILQSIRERMPSEIAIGKQTYADMKWLIEKIYEFLVESSRE